MVDITRAQLAVEMGVSERTLRRLLAGIPDLKCNRIGRKITFSPGDVATIRETMRRPYNLATAKPGAFKAVFTAGRKAASSANSAQERVRELTRKQLGRPATGKPALALLPSPGGRDTRLG